jgi:diguanylate cyclase (GGDEF)-like protein
MGEAAENLNPPVLEQFKQYEHFCKAMLDAWIVVDHTGRVLKCNALVSQVTNVKSKQVMKADSFDDVLKLSVASKPLSIMELLTSPGPTRVDEVTGKAEGRDDLNLIIGVYPFIDNNQTNGAFILLRDVTAETNLQDKYKHKATQSITDALTGLFNRNYFVEYMTSQVATLESFPIDAPQRIISVVMLDIDFFKKLNDGYGHQAGDHVIKHVADLLKKSFRKTDIVARYGGEEFLAILPGTDVQGAAIAADKLRLAVANYKFEFDGKVMPVTISSGVAQINVGNENGDGAIARADAALYFSKQQGRNRVSVHDGTKPVAPAIKIP